MVRLIVEIIGIYGGMVMEEVFNSFGMFNCRVSPGNSSKRNSHSSSRRSGRQQWMIAMEDSIRHGNGSTVTTQTTLVSIFYV